MAASANGVVLLTFRTSGTASAAKNARAVEMGLRNAGVGGMTGAKGLTRFSGGLQTLATRSNTGATAARNLLGAFAGFEALRRGTEFLKEAARAALDDAGGQRRLSIALKNSTGATTAQNEAVESWITKVATATGVADDDLRPAFQKLVESTGSITAAQDQLGIAMNASVGTGKSLMTVTAAMAKANKGNTAGLSRLGIATKDAKGHTLTATDAFAKMSKLFGGQMKTQTESAEGKMLRLTNQLDEAKETIGYKLMPVFTKFLKWILKYAVPWLLDLIDAWDKNRGAVGKFKAGLKIAWDVLQTVFKWISDNKETVKDLATGIGLVTAAVWLWTAAQTALDAAMDANPVGLIILAIGALVGVIVYLVKNWDAFVWGIRVLWQGFVNWITGIITQFVGWWMRIWQQGITFFIQLWTNLNNWVRNTFVAPFLHMFRLVKYQWELIWTGIGATFESVWNGIGDFFHGAANGVLGGLQSFVNAAIDIVNGITAGVSMSWTWIPGTQAIPSIPHVTMPKLARGGDVDAGSPYVVGDAGRPELFVPGSDGHVFPRVPTLTGMSAADISSSLTPVKASGGSGGSVSQAIQLMMDGDVLMEWFVDAAGKALARQ